MGGATPGPWAPEPRAVRAATAATRWSRGLPPRHPVQSPKEIPRSRADSIVSLSSVTVFMRLIADLSGS